jgi:uncharacterized protein (DUF1697 family)
MPALQAIVEPLPVREVTTFIANGNLIVSSRRSDPRRLEQQLSAHLESELGCPGGVTIRTPTELATIVN